MSGLLVTMRPSNKGLVDIIKMLKHGTVMVEVGCYAGESMEIWARSGKVSRIICVDPWRDGYDMKDHLAYQCGMAVVEKAFDDRLAKLIDDDCEIVKLKMSSTEASGLFADETFDFVYIDGNHFYEYVVKDINFWRSKIKPGGIIGGHDYRMDKKTGLPAPVARAVLDVLGEPDKIFVDSSWIKVLA